MSGAATAAERARRGLLLFLAAIPALVALPLVIRRSAGGASHPAIDFACLAALCWTPAVAAGIAGWRMRDGFADLSLYPWTGSMVRPILIAIALPIAILSLSYGLAWWTRLAPFDPEALAGRSLAPGKDALRLAWTVERNLATGLGVWLLLALGEEIGWRGFLLPRLIRSGLPFPVLSSGVIWSLWHVPSVLWGSYPAGPNRALSVVMIRVTLTSFSFVLARLRLESGSVWPASLAHAAWNSVLYDSLEPATRVPTLWTRESGVFVALASAACAALFWRGAWTVPLEPGDTPRAPREIAA